MTRIRNYMNVCIVKNEKKKIVLRKIRYEFEWNRN